jgi:large subunit ribosomal protein L29
MRAEKVRELDSNELNTQLNDSQEQLFRLKFQLNMGQNEGMKKYRELKKDRARMMTILHERALNPEANPEPVAKKTKKGKK